jgi:hypothetical protein
MNDYDIILAAIAEQERKIAAEAEAVKKPKKRFR